MNTCKECGARMKYLGQGTLMCEALYDLALVRHLAGDDRVVDHGALKEEHDARPLA